MTSLLNYQIILVENSGRELTTVNNYNNPAITQYAHIVFLTSIRRRPNVRDAI